MLCRLDPDRALLSLESVPVSSVTLMDDSEAQS